jgi:hypothetical protein
MKRPCLFHRALIFAACLLSLSAPPRLPAATAAVAGPNDPWTLDQRYAPPSWQTAICLPDDWQKTLVAKDGGLLYDYPGKFAGFGTKITFSVTDDFQWVKQELAGPRLPIVRTFKRVGDVEILEEAFAVAPPVPRRIAAQSPGLGVERVGSGGGQIGWAKPPAGTDPAFANVAIGWQAPIEYRFKAARDERFTVIFGLCEGWHTNAAQRMQELRIEGHTRRTVDLVAEQGRNVPALFAFPARDENGDGHVDLAVAAAAEAKDKNTILNLLWVFREGTAPPVEQLLAGPAQAPALARVDCGVDRSPAANPPPRHDVLLVTLRNPGNTAATVQPTLTVESVSPISTALDGRTITAGHQTTVFLPAGYETADRSETKLVARFAPIKLAPGQTQKLVFAAGRGVEPKRYPATMAEAEAALKKARRFWAEADLPYDRLVVPDAAVQALLDSCIRNIYQAREIKKDLPAFQVGPTCYRGLWVVDGAFLLEAITYLGRANETRSGVKYLLTFQRPDGGIMLIDGHWKETGIALWTLTRHAKLTGDKNWLREVWPNVERGFAYIGAMRAMPPQGAPNEGLIPDGFSDGGLADKVPEYTNIYWTLAGMRAAVQAARWLGQDAQAAAWQREYDDFEATFRRAAERDLKTDPSGHRYLPIRMAKGEGIPPQKAQWAFLHAVYPGQVFAASDPLVQGNMAMLKAVERQGLVFDTGWLKNGLWTYFGGFYGGAWLWLGEGDKAARTLYAFGNHASPLLCWREEQMPVGQGIGVVGDMPHNWASAEFIRLTRHCLALERGNALHLFEGFPAKWARPGALTRLKDIATEFGPLSLEFRVARDGQTGELTLTPPKRNPPAQIVWHLDPWSALKGTMELPTQGTVKRKIPLRTVR